jgi:histidinol-phosphatase
MSDDLELAFRMVDAADAVTSAAWTPAGVTALLKADGSPVTEADLAAERAMLAVLQRASAR